MSVVCSVVTTAHLQGGQCEYCGLESPRFDRSASLLASEGYHISDGDSYTTILSEPSIDDDDDDDDDDVPSTWT
jgi:hypothetical protein